MLVVSVEILIPQYMSIDLWKSFEIVICVFNLTIVAYCSSLQVLSGSSVTAMSMKSMKHSLWSS